MYLGKLEDQIKKNHFATKNCSDLSLFELKALDRLLGWILTNHAVINTTHFISNH